MASLHCLELTLLLLLFPMIICAQDNKTVDDDNLQKDKASPIGVYVYNYGNIFTLDEFFNSAKENIDSEDKNPPLVSSCRNYARQVKEQNIERLDIEKAAHNLALQLRDISNYELGVTEMQKIYDKLPFKQYNVNYKEQVEMIAGKIKKKIGNYLESLSKNKRYVEELYIHHLWSLPVQSIKSCYGFSNVEYLQNFRRKVNISESCEAILPSEMFHSFGFSPGRNMTKLLQQNLKSHPFMKWQYFMTSTGIHSEFPAYHLPEKKAKDTEYLYDMFRHNDVFTSTIYPKSKLVVILMDVSHSMSDEQLNLSIGIINSLSEHDHVTVLRLASTVECLFCGYDTCKSGQFLKVDDYLKKEMADYIPSLKKMIIGFRANHSLGFEKSFEVISEWMESHQMPVQPVIFYLGRGLIRSFKEGQDTLKIIAKENGKLNNSVVINTCTIVDKEMPNMSERQFLKVIAQQRYNVSTNAPTVRKGKFVQYNLKSNLRSVINTLWSSLKPTSSSEAYFSLPKWDTVGEGAVISVGKPCFHMRNVIGLVGIDIHINDFAEDIVFMNSIPMLDSHSFILHKNGQVIAHSTLGRAGKLDSSSMLTTDISYFYKNVMNFHSLRKKLLSDYIGQRKLRLRKRLVTNETFDNSMKVHTHALFTWRRIDDTPYIVCVVIYNNTNTKKQKKILDLNKSSCSDHVSYHRLDINPPLKLQKSLCRSYDEIMSLESSVLYLGPSSFTQPYKYLNQPDTKEKLNSYFGYLCDTTNLIPNPGLKPNVKNEAAVVIRISEYWMEQMVVSQLNDYVVRRYVGLPSGVVHAFPGTVINRQYEVTRQHWYLEALEHKGKVVMTSSYSDEDRMETFVTLSHTIYEGQHWSMHSTDDSVVAVMAMDVTVGFIHQLLTMSIPVCQETNVRCFIFDSKGYFVTHPNLVKTRKFNHITHGEQLVANDILCHEGFVEKHACYDYLSQTVQRSYRFNTKWSGVLRNLVHGEHCARYEITSIPNTNMFLGVINQTCDVQIAFCSCSIMDRLCLNCKRMDQTECACPCECPVRLDVCNNQAKSLNLEMCPKVVQNPIVAKVDNTASNDLKRCDNIVCGSRKHGNCLGVVGCIWCTENFDGSSLQQPFCSEQIKCYRGRLVNQAAFRGETYTTNSFSESTSFVMAITCGIFTVFMFLTFFIFYSCKFRNRNESAIQGNISSCAQPDNNAFKMLTFDNDPGDCIDEAEHALNPQDMLLADFQNVSPYRFNSTYRRPNMCGCSDHGYSTMTPLEDSVHNGLTNSEQLAPTIVNRNSATTQSLTSYDSEISSEPSTRLLSPIVDHQTVLPKNMDFKDGGTRIVARAQVHMVEC